MSQLNLFGDEGSASTATADPPTKKRGSRGECCVCGRMICVCALSPKGQAIAKTKLKSKGSVSTPDEDEPKDVNVKLTWCHSIAWSALKKMIDPDADDTIQVNGIDIDLGDGTYTANEIALYAEFEFGPPASIQDLKKVVNELTTKKRGCIAIKTTKQVCRSSGQMAQGFSVNRKIKPIISNEDGS